MKRYTVNVTAKMSGSVEVEAETEEEAIEKAGAMDPEEWDDSCVDDTEATDPDCLSELCDECEEDVDDCTCEVCDQCDRLVDDCECDEEEEDEDEDE